MTHLHHAGLPASNQQLSESRDGAPRGERAAFGALPRLARADNGWCACRRSAPISPRDRENYFLNRVEHAAAIVKKIGAPNVRIQFDFYHAQIVGGDLIRRLETHFPLVGHVQIAAVPTRREPDEGEVNFSEIFAALGRLGFSGFIGCEYRPRARTEDGLGWAKSYGVVPKGS